MGGVLIVTPLLRRLQARDLKHLSMCDLLTRPCVDFSVLHLGPNMVVTMRRFFVDFDMMVVTMR